MRTAAIANPSLATATTPRRLGARAIVPKLLLAATAGSGGRRREKAAQDCNKAERSKMLDPQFRQVVADSIARGIIQFNRRLF